MGRVADRTDAELLDASRAGDRDAFGAIVARYQRMVMAVSLDEDVAQDTFVTAWRRLGTLREADKLPGWLCGIARNLGRSSVRRRGREVLYEVEQEDGASSAYEAIASREDAGAVATALARMPDTYRKPLELFYGDDERSVREVASVLGISEQAAMQRLSRGRSQLGRDLVAAVAAAIALVGVGSGGLGSRVEAATRNAGDKTMWKLGIVAAVVAATAGTGIVVARSGGDEGPRSSVLGPRPEADPTATSQARGATSPTGAAISARGISGSGQRNGSATGRGPRSVDRGPVAVALTCSDAARRFGDLALEADVDLAKYTQDQRATLAASIAEHFEDTCKKARWSQEHLQCIVDAPTLFGAGAACGSIDTSMEHLPPPEPTGATMVPRRTTPVPAAPLTDLSCTAVGAHVALILTPDEPAYAQLPADQRESIRQGMAKALETMPDQIDGSCTQAAWTESVRKCLLQSTTDVEMGACTDGLKMF